MWDLTFGGACVLGGAYFYAVSAGRINDSEANAEYWARLRQQQPQFMKFGPPFVIAFGIFRLLAAAM